MLRLYQQRAVDEILEHYRQGQYRIVNLRNPPGSGSTRIACEVITQFCHMRDILTVDRTVKFASYYITIPEPPRTRPARSPKPRVLIAIPSANHHLFQWLTELKNHPDDQYDIVTFDHISTNPHMHGKFYDLLIVDSPLTHFHIQHCKLIESNFCLVLVSYLDLYLEARNLTFRGPTHAHDNEIWRESSVTTLSIPQFTSEFHEYSCTIQYNPELQIEHNPTCLALLASQRFKALLYTLGAHVVSDFSALFKERANAQSWYTMLRNACVTTDPQSMLKTINRGVERDTDQCPCCYDVQAEVLTPCNHAFCAECIFRWLSTSHDHSCPVCRQFIAFEDLILKCDSLEPYQISDQRPLISELSALLAKIRHSRKKHTPGHVILRTGRSLHEGAHLARRLRERGFYAVSLHKCRGNQRARILEEFHTSVFREPKILVIHHPVELSNLDGLQRSVDTIIDMNSVLSPPNETKYLKARVLRIGIERGFCLHYYKFQNMFGI